MGDESSAEPTLPPVHGWIPSNPASAIYGTIVTAGLLAAEDAGQHGVRDLVTSVAVTLLVFWLAHAYTDMMGGLITQHRSQERPNLGRALREESPILASGLLPLLTLMIAHSLGATESSAVTAALIIAVVEICGWALLAGREMKLTHCRLATFVATSGCLGAVIIVLKALVH